MIILPTNSVARLVLVVKLILSVKSITHIVT